MTSTRAELRDEPGAAPAAEELLPSPTPPALSDLPGAAREEAPTPAAPRLGPLQRRAVAKSRGRAQAAAPGAAQLPGSPGRQAAPPRSGLAWPGPAQPP